MRHYTLIEEALIVVGYEELVVNQFLFDVVSDLVKVLQKISIFVRFKMMQLSMRISFMQFTIVLQSFLLSFA